MMRTAMTLAIAFLCAPAAAKSSPAFVYGLHQTIESSAVFPELGRFYVLTGVAGENPTIEMRALSDGGLVRTINACRSPQELVPSRQRARLYVACAVGSGGEDPTMIVVIDARSGEVEHYSLANDELTLHVDDAVDLPFIYGSAEHPVRLDARTGRVIATLLHLGRIFKADAGRLYTWEDARESIAVVDERTGELQAHLHVGLMREPADIAIDTAHRRAYIAFSRAGTIGIYASDSGRLLRTVSSAEFPAAVDADAAGRRFFGVSGDGSANRTVLELFGADGKNRRDLVLDPNGLQSGSGGRGPAARILRDQRSGRLVVADSDSITVLAGTGLKRLFTVRTPASGRLLRLDLDGKTGIVYGLWNAREDGFFMRVEVRSGSPREIKYAGATIALGHAAPREPVIESFKAPPGLPPPANDAPPGVRSPQFLAAGPNGLLAVGLYGEPSIGIMKDGTYSQRRLHLRGTPASIAVDAANSVWFSEFSATDKTFIGRLTSDGRVREFVLPAYQSHSATSDSIAKAGQSPPMLVTGTDGFIWGFDAARERVLRIDLFGNVRAFALPRQDRNASNAAATIAPRAQGGVYVAGERVWSVATGGAIEAFSPPLNMGSIDYVRTHGHNVRFIGADLIATASPGGGITAIPIDRFTLALTRSEPGTSTSAACAVSGLVVGNDGLNWVSCGNAIIRVDADGFMRTYTMPTPQSNPTALTLAADGSIWFAEPTHSKIGVLHADGSIKEFTI